MKKNLTEMVFILDRSGSMSGLETDTIGGYNGLLDKQRKEEGEAVVTTVLFDDQYEVIHDRADIKKVAPITGKEYYARGMTGLLDAIGRTVTTVEKRHKFAPDCEIPEKTVVVIITDGHENASREYNIVQVRKMIEEHTEKDGWEFMFLGANIDAVSTAAGFGISADRSVTYQADSEGTRVNFETISDAMTCMRSSSERVDGRWKERIENHMKKSGKK